VVIQHFDRDDEISKTLVINSAMMQLAAQEDFSIFICVKT
jgi:hypothetical protein